MENDSAGYTHSSFPVPPGGNFCGPSPHLLFAFHEAELTELDE